MTWLSDSALARLRVAMDTPDLTGTRYQFVEKLGHGGMGDVYAVEDTVLARRVALKAIMMADGSEQLTIRLLQEARVIARLEHPGIVPVHDAGTLPDGRVYYTMKLVNGARLDRHVAEVQSLTDRLRIFQKICEAVSFAHSRGVLHRDLKPQNVMVGAFGEVLVMDWGLSKLLGTRNPATLPAGDPKGTKRETSDGAVLGTPGYMSPEQQRGQELDVRSDVFSLGALLKSLFPENAPRAVAAIAQKAMGAVPAERYPTVASLSADVASYLDGFPVVAYPESALTRTWRWLVRNRAWILLVLAYLAMRTLFILWRRQ
jgi:eukaryotic-like serine/threonine-protein kinase